MQVAQKLLDQPGLRGLQGPTISTVYNKTEDGTIGPCGYFDCTICIPKKQIYAAVKGFRQVGSCCCTALCSAVLSDAGTCCAVLLQAATCHIVPSLVMLCQGVAEVMPQRSSTPGCNAERHAAIHGINNNPTTRNLHGKQPIKV